MNSIQTTVKIIEDAVRAELDRRGLKNFDAYVSSQKHRNEDMFRLTISNGLMQGTTKYFGAHYKKQDKYLIFCHDRRTRMHLENEDGVHYTPFRVDNTDILQSLVQNMISSSMKSLDHKPKLLKVPRGPSL